MIHTLSRALAMALLLAILATVAIAYHASTSYTTTTHATCVRTIYAHVGAMAVQIEGAC